MNKKMLGALALSLAILAALPALAGATTLQANGVAVKVNGEVKMFSTNPVFTIEGGTAGTIKCEEGEIVGELFNAPGEEVPLVGINNDRWEAMGKKGRCATSSATVWADTTTNRATAGWHLEVQQPAANGQITAHVTSLSGFVEFSFQLQDNAGNPITLCRYRTPTVQLMGEEGSNVFKVEGTKQFERAAGNTMICGAMATFTGEFKLTSGGNPILVDMN